MSIPPSHPPRLNLLPPQPEDQEFILEKKIDTARRTESLEEILTYRSLELDEALVPILDEKVVETLSPRLAGRYFAQCLFAQGSLPDSSDTIQGLVVRYHETSSSLSLGSFLTSAFHEIARIAKRRPERIDESFLREECPFRELLLDFRKTLPVAGERLPSSPSSEAIMEHQGDLDLQLILAGTPSMAARYISCVSQARGQPCPQSEDEVADLILNHFASKSGAYGEHAITCACLDEELALCQAGSQRAQSFLREDSLSIKLITHFARKLGADYGSRVQILQEMMLQRQVDFQVDGLLTDAGEQALESYFDTLIDEGSLFLPPALKEFLGVMAQKITEHPAFGATKTGPAIGSFLMLRVLGSLLNRHGKKVCQLESIGKTTEKALQTLQHSYLEQDALVKDFRAKRSGAIRDTIATWKHDEHKQNLPADALRSRAKELFAAELRGKEQALKTMEKSLQRMRGNQKRNLLLLGHAKSQQKNALLLQQCLMRLCTSGSPVDGIANQSLDAEVQAKIKDPRLLTLMQAYYPRMQGLFCRFIGKGLVPVDWLQADAVERQCLSFSKLGSSSGDPDSE